MKFIDFQYVPNLNDLNPKIDWQNDIIQFWKEWKNEEDFIIVNTSGSTGNPKPIKLKKEAVRASARLTNTYFNLHKGMHALLCLPTLYIAGKMMLIRAELAGMKLWLIEPKLNIEIEQKIDFCAMTPSQCKQSLESVSLIKTLILGGEKVSDNLRQKLNSLTTEVYETYGMTETISHIGVRNLKVENSAFQTIGEVKVCQEKGGRLRIDAPHISEKPIITNDIAFVHENGEFELLGRADNVINSGGKKIHPELLEERLKSKLGMEGIFFGEKDAQLGERLVLIVEAGNNIQIADLQNIGFQKHEIPKYIYKTNKIEKTPNGKMDRQKNIKKIEK